MLPLYNVFKSYLFNTLRGLIISAQLFWLLFWLLIATEADNKLADATLDYIIWLTFVSPFLVLVMYATQPERKNTWLYLGFPLVGFVIGVILVIPLVEAMAIFSDLFSGAVFYR